MWIKKHNDITQHIQEDGKWHDIQITNNMIWVDGELRNSSADGFTDVRIFNRVLSEKEIQNLAANKSLKDDA